MRISEGEERGKQMFYQGMDKILKFKDFPL